MEFREPTIADCDQIEAYRQAFEKNQEVIHGGAGLVESPTAKDWLKGLADFKTAETVPEGFVPARTCPYLSGYPRSKSGRSLESASDT